LLGKRKNPTSSCELQGLILQKMTTHSHMKEDWWNLLAGSKTAAASFVRRI
jgi:hypothetical protein